jgi:SAM-dependent methyltransferase
MNKKIILNLGCGNKKADDEIGVDIIDLPEVDVVTDLNKYPLPFDENSVDEIRSYHCFEHLDDLVALMNDIYRILKPGGILLCTVPHVSNIEYFRDPTHKRPFISSTMDYFIKGHKPIAYTDIEFEYIRKELIFSKSLNAKIGKLISKISTRKYEKYYCWKYPCYEIKYEMKSLKQP